MNQGYFAFLLTLSRLQSISRSLSRRSGSRAVEDNRRSTPKAASPIFHSLGLLQSDTFGPETPLSSPHRRRLPLSPTVMELCSVHMQAWTRLSVRLTKQRVPDRYLSRGALVFMDPIRSDSHLSSFPSSVTTTMSHWGQSASATRVMTPNMRCRLRERTT